MRKIIALLVIVCVVAWFASRPAAPGTMATHVPPERMSVSLAEAPVWSGPFSTASSVEIVRVPPPAIPELPPVDRSSKESLDNSLRMRVRAIVLAHPSSTISEGLLREVVKRKNLSIGFDVFREGAVAQFVVLEASDVREVEGGNVRTYNPMIMLDPALLASELTANDVYHLMLVLSQQYQYYLQYSARLSVGGDIRPFLLHSTRGDYTFAQGERVFNDQSEAYALECALGLSWGIELPRDLAELCAHYGAPQWNQVMFYLISNSFEMGSHKYPNEFFVGLATAAGHPQPQAFRDL